jgi:hypothetical protein
MIRSVSPLLLCLALAAGCAAPTAHESTPAYSRYTLEDVVAWSKAGEAPERIIARLAAANAFYPLTASELISLRDKGVSPQVLDFLLERYVATVRRDARFGLDR